MRKSKRKQFRAPQSVIESLETRRLMAAINVIDFGARPNDGVDDTSAIRAAINASKSGDTILFGGGVYNVSDTIQLKSHRTYTGGGTIKRPAGQDFIFNTDGENTGIKINNLTLEGGGFHAGNGRAKHMEVTQTRFQNITRGWPTGNAILLSAGAEHSKFNNNSFVNINGETGIYGFANFHEVEMNNNYFDNVMEGIHLAYDGGGSNLYVNNNTFIRTRRMAIELQGHNAKNIYVEGNKASEWRDNYHGSFFLSIVNQGHGIYIRNNHGASGKFGEIDPKAKDTPVGMEISGWGVVVEGNVIEGFREGAHLMNIRDAVVRNNKFYNNTWMAIWRTGISTGEFNGTNIRIENNEIYNPKSTAFLFHGKSSGYIGNNTIYLFSGKEYTEGGSGAYNNVNRAGNNIIHPGGSPKAYTGKSPVTGNPGGGNSGGGNSGGGDSTPIPSAPASPGNLQVIARGPSQIDVSWGDNASNETGFKVFRRDNSTEQWVLIATLDKNATAYKDGDVQAGKHYSYRVQAYNADGHSGFSNEHNAYTSSVGGGNQEPDKPLPPPEQPKEPEPNDPTPSVGAPALPSGLKVATRSATQIDVAWADNADNEAGYKVFRRDNSTTQWVLIATVGADAQAYRDGGVQAGKHYSYKVQAINESGASAFSNEHNAFTPADNSNPQPQPQPSPPPTPNPGDQPGVHPGLFGEYFDNLDLTNKKGERIDGAIDFDWGQGRPFDGVGADTFSVRWTGQIEARYGEEYTFYAGSDDGVRLWIDGKLVIDSWHDQRMTEKTGKITLEAGKKYNIKLEYYDNRVSAQVYLAWSSASQSKEIVPESQLSHPAAPSNNPHVGDGQGLTGEYFSNTDLTDRQLVRTEAVNFDWQYGSPHHAIEADTFSARWTGQILAQYSEEYTFYVTSDDGVRLWVDGNLIVDHWNDQPSTTRTGKITLEAGRKYDIRMEYYENGGAASAMLGWSSRSQSWEIVPASQLFASTGVEPIEQPDLGTDLALGKQATASSVQSGKWERVNYLTDGNDATRWASTLGSDNEWIYVDLGASYDVGRVRLNWEQAYARSYLIQVSDDAKTWTTVYETAEGDGGIDDVADLSGTGRFVRMVGLERGYPAGFSLWSMEVYGAN